KVGWKDSTPVWFPVSFRKYTGGFFRYVNEIDCEDGTLTDQDLRAMGALGGLQSLRVGPQVSDAGLSRIGRLTHLRYLDLSGSKVRDLNSFAYCDFRNLLTLDASGSSITNKGFSRFAGAKVLYWINLDSTGITDQGMGALAECKSLTGLNLRDTKITDNGLKSLSGLKRIEYLALAWTRIQGKGLRYLQDSVGLIDIELRRSDCNDDGLAYLDGFPKLRAIQLNGTKVTDKGLAKLQNLPALEILNLRETQATIRGLAQLKRSKLLGNVSISSRKGLDEDDYRVLGSFMLLKHLRLEVEPVTIEMVDRLLSFRQKITWLELPEKTPLLTEEFMKQYHGSRNRRLTTFSIYDDNF
ncbi:MAG: hypothetical protein KDA68_22615, partial [Planctomycetaceae bacterium]|nr:hypothetical protein [Planctomycetaceae bacterium]